VSDYPGNLPAVASAAQMRRVRRGVSTIVWAFRGDGGVKEIDESDRKQFLRVVFLNLAILEAIWA
jgi:hypothetical protein